MKKFDTRFLSSTRQAALAAGVGVLCSVAAADKVSAPARPSHEAPVTEPAPGLIRIGRVMLNRATQSVTFPAALNLSSGPIEYLLVTSTGKTHESLLRTDIRPYHLQVAMLLLGAEGASPALLTDAPPAGPIIGARLAREDPPRLPGSPVRVWVQWQHGDRVKRVPIEHLVLNVKQGAPMSGGPFVFNGSRVWNGTFIAERDGSIISTVTDPDAMFNNPRPGRNDDQNWQVLPTELPPVGTPMRVTITLQSHPEIRNQR